MEEIVIKNSQWKCFGLAVLCIGSALFFYLIRDSLIDWIILIFALFFAIGSLFFIWMGFDSSPKVIIDNEGIWAVSFSRKLVWSEIDEVTIPYSSAIQLKPKYKVFANPEIRQNLLGKILDTFIVDLTLSNKNSHFVFFQNY